MTVLPRNIATKAAFENAMALDVAMGGSTNTVLHILAMAHEGEIDFKMSDIGAISRRVPVLCKVAPAKQDVHMEDVHRAGGIMAILGQLDGAGLLNREVPTIHSRSIGAAVDQWDISRTNQTNVRDFFRAAPGGVRTTTAFQATGRYDTLDLDRENGVIRSADTPFSKDGGLAVLTGNLAPDGCIVKTAGVDEAIVVFSGPARVFESRNAAVNAILAKKIREGDVLVIRYEGPKGGPGLQEMLYPTSYLKSMGLGTACALVTDGRFSGGTSGLSIGHLSPDAAAGGMIGLVREFDMVDIDIPKRTISLRVAEAELAARRAAQDRAGWVPVAPRSRKVSQALRAYALFASSADTGAVGVLPGE